MVRVPELNNNSQTDEVTAFAFFSSGFCKLVGGCVCVGVLPSGVGSLLDSDTFHSVGPTLFLPAKSPGEPGAQFPRRWVSLDLPAQTKASQPPAPGSPGF